MKWIIIIFLLGQAITSMITNCVRLYQKQYNSFWSYALGTILNCLCWIAVLDYII